jgi:PKD repeat protein
LVTYDSAGLYAVELWVWNSAGETEIRQEAFIEVKTIPEVSFNYIEQDSLTIELEGEVIGDSTATIKWHFGDGQSLSTQENVVYTYSEPGSYEVVLIARNECGGDTSTQLIELETTTSSYHAALQGVRIYPNPADDKLVVDRLPQNSRLNIVDAFGKHIYSTVPEHSSVKLNVSSWPAGMYHMTIAVAEEMATFRVVVQE